MIPYLRYSDFLFAEYGERVYKLPINIPVTCPNRINGKGCTFCDDDGAGFENLSSSLSVKAQIYITKEKMRKKYKANRYIVYFQNYTNTFLPLTEFEAIMKDALDDEIVEIAISTRPDCINDDYLDILKSIADKNNIKISIELGLQTVNYHTLKKINRGHGLAEFIDAVNRTNRYGFHICAHIILNLPWDNLDDVIECSKIVSALGVHSVKLHSLYIVKKTVMHEQFLNDEFEICTVEEYIERVITFLEYLAPDIAIQRLLGRAPKNITEFSNWSMSWWKIKDRIDEIMIDTSRIQGSKCDYLNGKEVKRFLNI